MNLRDEEIEYTKADYYEGWTEQEKAIPTEKVKKAVLEFQEYLIGNVPKFPDSRERYTDFDLINTNTDLIKKFQEIFGDFEK